MAEYIEREALPGANTNDNDYADGWNECLEAINSIPAADVRPVITCGECKHWETDWTPRSVSDGRHYCAPLDLFPSADWYCSDGEKREES